MSLATKTANMPNIGGLSSLNRTMSELTDASRSNSQDIGSLLNGSTNPQNNSTSADSTSKKLSDISEDELKNLSIDELKEKLNADDETLSEQLKDQLKNKGFDENALKSLTNDDMKSLLDAKETMSDVINRKNRDELGNMLGLKPDDAKQYSINDLRSMANKEFGSQKLNNNSATDNTNPFNNSGTADSSNGSNADNYNDSDSLAGGSGATGGAGSGSGGNAAGGCASGNCSGDTSTNSAQNLDDGKDIPFVPLKTDNKEFAAAAEKIASRINDSSLKKSFNEACQFLADYKPTGKNDGTTEMSESLRNQLMNSIVAQKDTLNIRKGGLGGGTLGLASMNMGKSKQATITISPQAGKSSMGQTAVLLHEMTHTSGMFYGNHGDETKSEVVAESYRDSKGQGIYSNNRQLAAQRTYGQNRNVNNYVAQA